jgi:hypothetical protein
MKLMDSLSRKLSLESAMSSASAFLERNPSTKRDAISHPSDLSLPRTEANKLKIASLTSELYKLSRKEADQRTKLLRHYTAALSLMLKKRDESSSTAVDSNSSQRSSKAVVSLHSFEGPHLFASHLDAASLHSNPSLFSSLPMSASSGSMNDITPAAAAALDNRCSELQTELEQVKEDLKESRQDLMRAEDYAGRSRDETRRLSEEVARLRESSALQQAERDELKERCERAEGLVSRLETRLSVSREQIDAAEAKARSGASSGRQERERLREAVMGVLVRHKNRQGPLAAHLPEPPTADEPDMVRYLGDALDDHFAQMNQHLASLESDRATHGDAKSSLVTELERAEADMAKWHNEAEFVRREKAGIESSYRELQLRFQDETQRQSSSLAAAERDLRQAKATEAQLRTELAEATSGTQPLQELFRLLPPSNEASRRSLSQDTDLREYREALTNARRPRGDFSLDVRNQKFSVEALVDRVRSLIEDDKRLVDRLMKHEESRDGFKAEAERTQRMLDESKEGLATYQKQVSVDPHRG